MQNIATPLNLVNRWSFFQTSSLKFPNVLMVSSSSAGSVTKTSRKDMNMLSGSLLSSDQENERSFLQRARARKDNSRICCELL